MESTKRKILVCKKEETSIEKSKTVNVYFSPNFMLVTDKLHCHEFGYVKLSKHECMNLKTGELKKIKHYTGADRSVGSLKKTYFKLALLINSNFVGDNTEAFITLTYNHEVDEYSMLNRDIRNFWVKLQRRSKIPNSYCAIIVLEYQRCGRPHVHVLLKRVDGQPLALSKENVGQIWNHGIVDIREITNATGLSEYLNPFNVSEKKRQLVYYKTGMQIYRCKGELIKPKKSKMSYHSALQLAELSGLQEYKSQSYSVIDKTSNNMINNVNKILFKKEQETYEHTS